MKKGAKPRAIPEWASRITFLRERLEINQAELARRLEVSAMTVSRWERGLLMPSAESFIRLGNFASKSNCWFFWEHAGLEVAKVSDTFERHKSPRPLALPELEQAHAGASGDVVALPLLRAVASAHGGVTDRHLSLRMIPATKRVGVPKDWCPNPRYTSMLRVKGHSMEPLIRNGDILAVDSVQTERTKLRGKIVVAANEKNGLCVSRLRRYENFDVLESENREYEPAVLSKASGWRILGRVLWWISAAP